jgi:tRNA (guanine37-N1)-methyltransferase
MSRIALGIIRKAHGIRGEASVEAWTDSLERFNDLSHATLVSHDEQETREVTIESCRIHSGRVLLKFGEIGSPEDLREVQGWTVEIPESEARALEVDEVFMHDLVGLKLVDLEGRDRGVVTDAFEGGGGVLLTVRRGEKEYDVPFASAICRSVDIREKRIVVDLPVGLDDLESVTAIEDEAPNAAILPDATRRAKLRIDFVTIFPGMFEPLLAEGVIGRGMKQGLLDVHVWDLRDFATDKHRSTDDEAYGGGPGMVMLAEPVLRCVERIRSEGGGAADESQPAAHIVMTTPQGRPFTQPVALDFAGNGWLIFLCGRYEGFDHRVHEILQPDEISVGDFVVSGGELPAMLIADAVGRMIEGVVGNSGSVEEDSFFNGLLDYPHYTRPEELRGMRVPEILMSGHHEHIRHWRKEQALRATLVKRPDLLETAELDEEARAILAEIAPDSSWAKNAPAEPGARRKPKK